MSLAAKIRRAPLRVATGAFILNTGISKLGGDDDAAKATHSRAAGAFPMLEKVPPKPFFKALAVGETALGAALLLPVVPAGLAGIALTGFSGALLGMWWRTPGMHAEGSPRPTRDGTAIAKDVWMLGIGTSLLVDAALNESKVTDERSRAETKAAIKSEAKATRKATKRAAKRARKRAEQLLPT
jgi:hypothetical protein